MYLRIILIHIALGKLRDVYEIFTQQIKHYTKIDKNFQVDIIYGVRYLTD